MYCFLAVGVAKTALILGAVASLWAFNPKKTDRKMQDDEDCESGEAVKGLPPNRASLVQQKVDKINVKSPSQLVLKKEPVSRNSSGFS